MLAEWLTHSPATLMVTGSRPSFGDISEVKFSNRYSLQHRGTQNGLSGVAEIVMSADRISSFHLKVAFRIAIQMQSSLLLLILLVLVLCHNTCFNVAVTDGCLTFCAVNNKCSYLIANRLIFANANAALLLYLNSTSVALIHGG